MGVVTGSTSGSEAGIGQKAGSGGGKIDSAKGRLLWIGMLRVYTAFLERGLLKEFAHTRDVLQQWAGVFAEELLPTLSVWAHWEDSARQEERAALAYFRDQVKQAVEELQREPTPEFSTVAMTYKALKHISLASRALCNCLLDGRQHEGQAWRHFRFKMLEAASTWPLPAWVPLPEIAFPSPQKVAGKLDDTVREFRKALSGNGDESRCCRASRRVCQILLSLLTLYPRAWSPDRHQEIIWVHRRALERMQPSKLHQAVQDRLQYVLLLSEPPHTTLKGFFGKALADD